MKTSSRAVLTILLSAVALPLLAQTPRSGGGGANQQMMQQYQQLATEKSALEEQVASMKHDLDSAHAQLETEKKAMDELKARLNAASSAGTAELNAAKQAAQKSAEQNTQRMDELVTRFRQTATDLKQVETDRDRLRGQLSERSSAFDQCASDNLSLFELNGDILKRYENVGFFTRAAAIEPFTGITRNRIENLVDRYRARALELRAKNASDSEGQGAKAPAVR